MNDKTSVRNTLLLLLLLGISNVSLANVGTPLTWGTMAHPTVGNIVLGILEGGKIDHSLFIPFAILFYVVAFLVIKKFWGNWIADRIEEISVFWLTVIYVIVIPLSLLPLRICYDFIFEWLLGV